jgi:hypothetical protein
MGRSRRHRRGCVKKTKRIKPVAPIYGAAADAPLHLDMLTIAASRSQDSVLVQLSEFLGRVQHEMANAAPRNDEARDFAEKCRQLWPHVVADACSLPSTNDHIGEAMLRALELGFAFHAFAVSNGLQSSIQSARALRDAGKKGAAKRHSSAREIKRKIKQADGLRVANEQRKGGVPEASIAKRLSSKLGVKPDTAKRMLRKSGHLPAARRHRSP